MGGAILRGCLAGKEIQPEQIYVTADEFRAWAIGVARRVHGRDTDQIAGERDGFVAAAFDQGEEAVGGHFGFKSYTGRSTASALR